MVIRRHFDQLGRIYALGWTENEHMAAFDGNEIVRPSFPPLLR
jgi:hypothetical protein